MKRMPGAIIVLISLILLSWINYTLIRNLETKITENIDYSLNAIMSDDYENANDYLQDAQTIFQNSEGYLGAVVRHAELDSAFLSFARLSALLQVQDKDSYIEECEVLKKMIEHISDMESLSIRNVL